jgi:hypothetical protein
MLLLEDAPRSRRRSSDQPDQGDGKNFGPRCRQIHAPWHGIGDPTSRGWPIFQRPRQRGPDSIVISDVSSLHGQIKSSIRHSLPFNSNSPSASATLIFTKRSTIQGWMRNKTVRQRGTRELIYPIGLCSNVTVRDGNGAANPGRAQAGSNISCRCSWLFAADGATRSAQPKFCASTAVLWMRLWRSMVVASLRPQEMAY